MRVGRRKDFMWYIMKIVETGKAYHLQEYIQEHHNNISPLRKLLIVQNEV